METIFTLDNETTTNTQINIDELYERKKTHDLNTLSIYNKILSRVHNKIKVVSRQHLTIQYCWYVVPEMIIGVPHYDHESCVEYCIDQLNSNGFMVRYTHPNLLLISWKHWVPSYVRKEIKKKTGIAIDGRGNQLGESTQKSFEISHASHISKPSKNKDENFKDISTYKPTGIYNNELLRNIEKKYQNPA